MTIAELPMESRRVRTLPIAFEEKTDRFTTIQTIGRIEGWPDDTTTTVVDGKLVTLPTPPVLMLPGRMTRAQWEAAKTAVDAAWERWEALQSPVTP